MQSELKSLSKIFSEAVFRIPDYQRGYSWERKHLKDFWNDIEQLPLGKSHYTGVLTLEPVPPELYRSWEDDAWIIDSKRYSPMYVVDGQQRLTTAIILLQCILDSIDDNELLNYTEKADVKKKYIFEAKGKGISRSYLFGYEKDNPSHEFLKQEIYGESSVNHSTIEDTIYTKNLNFAKVFFADKLKPLNKEEIEAIYTKLTQHLQFNIFYIEKDLDVFVTFETMNNRGKPLSHLELLKNRLIYLSTKFDVEKTESEHLRKAINESWKTIYHYLGKMADYKKDDDDFLRTHFVSYFGEHLVHKFESIHKARNFMRYGDEYKEYLLDEFFTPKRLTNGLAQLEINLPVNEGEGQPPNGSLNPLDIQTVFDYSQSIKSLVKSYYSVANPEFGNWSDEDKLKLSQINRLNDNSIFTLCTAVQKIENFDARTGALVAIERYGFLRKLRSYYFSDIDCIDLAGQVFRDELDATALIKLLGEKCDAFSRSKEFQESVKHLGKNLSSGYYSWAELRYFMYEYEQELRRLSKTSRELLKWSDDMARENYNRDHKTVEHIYPQKASSDYWKDRFSKYSVKERNTLKNSLGNLLPVSHGKNSSLSNKSFDDKKGTEQNQVGYLYGCLSEIQVATNAEWTAKDILRRGIYLLGFLETRWSVKIGDPVKKASFLGLNFVLEKEGADLASIVNKAVPIPTPPDDKVQLAERTDY
jgi:uncharacterized protein with ParB-like and HNH nuclease domain